MRRLVLSIVTLAVLMTWAENKSYITRVFDFKPAPGQFINVLPSYEAGEPRDSVLARVLSDIGGKSVDVIEYDDDDNEIIVGTRVIPVTSEVVCLGSYGGYVTFGFDHPVVNVEGEYDLQIFGNAFKSDSMAVSGGSCEPGIVMVGVDVDGDGVPGDGDLWYELAGSEHGNVKTQKNFTITYYKPASDADNIRWICNSTDSLTEGYVHRNAAFHSQPYWPQWVSDATMTFTGTKLPCNANDLSGNGTYYVQYFFDWGYVDNKPDYDWSTAPQESEGKQKNLGFKLDWAVDADGNPVKLKKVDFIKVYNGILQECGWLGETSTEVKGAIDLHPDAPLPEDPQIKGDVTGDGIVDVADVNGVINAILGKSDKSAVADVTGDGTIDVADVNAVINIILNR